MTELTTHRHRFWERTVLGPMLAGLLYLGAFAPANLSPMVVAGLMAFLYCLRGLGPVEARRAGFLFGMVVTCAGCFWLRNIFGWVFIVLCAAQSLFWGLFGWGHAVIDRQPWSRWRKALAVACVWTGVEFIRAEHFWLDFPWLTPGHGLGVIQFVTQPLLSSIGVYGVGFVVVCGSGLLQPLLQRVAGARRWRAAGQSPPNASNVAYLATLVVLYLILAVHYLSSSFCEFNSGAARRDGGLPAISFAAIQDEHGSLENFMTLTKDLSGKPDLIIWPEEAVPNDLARLPYDHELLLDLVKQKDCVLVLGTQEKGAGRAWRNTALTLDPSGERGRHYKMHPVHLFNDGTPGTEARPVPTRLGKIGTPICFDCDYEDVVRRMTRNGAAFFAVPSMDPIAWGPEERQMHSELFRIRAAENGRAMIVCATSGVTQAIDAWGINVWRWNQDRTPHDDGTLPIMVPGILAGELPIRTGFTFYTLYGWLFPWVALGASVLILGRVLVRERRT